VVHFANTEARRILGGRLREGDALPEPWQGFGLREFAQGLFDERASVKQVHVTPDEQHAYGVVGIPSQPETDWALLVVDDLTEQALRNLGENAAKHTARGSVVLRAYGDGNTVTIEVEDSGPGISPEVQRHVFDRFYRGERDAHGFGLGLAIVRESVRTLGA